MPTIPQAKNTIRKALFDILDAPPTVAEVAGIWQYFGSRCAYCEEALNREDQSGAPDHLVPRASGGSHHVANLVLACGRCNERRRDQDWRVYLEVKCGGQGRLFQTRVRRITNWVRKNGGFELQTNERLAALTERAQGPVVEALDRAAAELRALR